MDETNAVEEVVKEVQTPKYIMKLGEPVTHRWKDKNGVIQSRTYPIGSEFGVIFVYRVRKHNQKYADCVTPEGIVLTIGHNRKHTITPVEDKETT